MREGKPNEYGDKRCAEYVRRALNEGGGLNVGKPANGSVSASNYGRPLENAGFQDIASSESPSTYPSEGYAPRAGDVAIIQPTSQNPHGHMAMYNGSQWVSDFRQREFWPGRYYRDEKPSYVIYRYGVETISL